MYISSRPTDWVGAIAKRSSSGTRRVFPLESQNCAYFYSGRYALGHAIRLLGLQQDQSVLLPAYNCWVEIDPVLNQNANTKYYRVNEDFTVDVDHITRCIDHNTKAIVVTHYLGFPQDMEKVGRICQEKGIVVIEDCAHAFLSEYKGKPVGSFGEFSIFSFRKTLPISEGGALVVNRASVQIPRVAKRANWFASLYVYAEYLRFNTRLGEPGRRMDISEGLARLSYLVCYSIRILLRCWHKVMQDRGIYLVYPSSTEFRKALFERGPSRLSMRILRSCSLEEIRGSRRRNFQFYLDYFSGDGRVWLPIRELPDGVCPLFFPLWIEKRDMLYQALKKKGVAGHDWWGDFHPDVPWEDFPEARKMKEMVFGFPVHQDLTVEHLTRVVEEFETVYRRELTDQSAQRAAR